MDPEDALIKQINQNIEIKIDSEVANEFGNAGNIKADNGTKGIHVIDIEHRLMELINRNVEADNEIGVETGVKNDTLMKVMVVVIVVMMISLIALIKDDSNKQGISGFNIFMMCYALSAFYSCISRVHYCYVEKNMDNMSKLLWCIFGVVASLIVIGILFFF